MEFLAKRMMCRGRRSRIFAPERSSAMTGLTCASVCTPFSSSIFQKRIIMCPQVTASSEARWWLNSGRLRASATILSLYLPSSGSMFCARMSVSTYVGWNVRPNRCAAAEIKPTSKSALCAHSGRPATKPRNAGSASEISGAPASISSVMPVSSMIFGVSLRPGATKV